MHKHICKLQQGLEDAPRANTNLQVLILNSEGQQLKGQWTSKGPRPPQFYLTTILLLGLTIALYN